MLRVYFGGGSGRKNGLEGDGGMGGLDRGLKSGAVALRGRGTTFF